MHPRSAYKGKKIPRDQKPVTFFRNRIKAVFLKNITGFCRRRDKRNRNVLQVEPHIGREIDDSVFLLIAFRMDNVCMLDFFSAEFSGKGGKRCRCIVL
jgi:hypothetical protein